jgi:uncharacterized damage-inducible protein DinB
MVRSPDSFAPFAVNQYTHSMNSPEPALSFRELLAYTDYLAGRWMKYFRQNPAALEVNVGGRAGTVRGLAIHIFQVEEFFANLLSQEGAKGMGRPAQLESLSLEEMERMHGEARQKLAAYIASASEEKLQTARALGPVTASERKVLAQAVLHSMHHWAQVAMEVRQAGFPAEPPQDIIASPVMK